MGLDLEVGILADLARHDEEGCEHYRTEFAALNRLLASAGLPSHREPDDLPEERVWSCSMWGYSGLHALRRVAAHVALEGGLPQPSEDTTKDPVVERYYEQALRKTKTLLSLLRGRPRALPFQHLMLHSDAEGLYVPLDFSDVLFATEEVQISGDMVGSAPRLLAECRSLADLLKLPLDLDPESGEVVEAAEAKFALRPERDWRCYGAAAYSCLQLVRACEASLATGAALVFC